MTVHEAFLEQDLLDLQNKVEEKDKRITELEMTVGTLRTFSNEQATCIERLEKEIKSLGERCLQLQKDKGNLIDKVNDLEEKLANADYQLEGRDLEIKELKVQCDCEKCYSLARAYRNDNEKLKAQVEKMKCCYNCSKWNDGQCADIPDSGYCCADFVCEDWEIKEK